MPGRLGLSSQPAIGRGGRSREGAGHALSAGQLFRREGKGRSFEVSRRPAGPNGSRPGDEIEICSSLDRDQAAAVAVAKNETQFGRSGSTVAVIARSGCAGAAAAASFAQLLGSGRATV